MSIITDQPVIYVPENNSVSHTSNLTIDTSDKKTVTDDEFQIIMIVDKSGSMNGIRGDIIGSINSVIDDQKKISVENGVDAKFTLVTFNTYRSVVYNSVPINEVELLTPDQYQTTGGTALYKSVIKTLNENIHKTNVMAVIVTDGEDTYYDGIYTQQASSRAIKQRESNGWKFIYLSSDPTLVVQGVNMGIRSTDSGVRSCNTNNVHTNYRKLGTALRRQCSAEISRARTTGSMHGLGEKLICDNVDSEDEDLWGVLINSLTGLPDIDDIRRPVLTRSVSMIPISSLGIPTVRVHSTV